MTITQSYYVKDSIGLMHKKTQNNSAMVTDLYGLMNGCSINDCVPLDTIFLLSIFMPITKLQDN